MQALADCAWIIRFNQALSDELQNPDLSGVPETPKVFFCALFEADLPAHR